MAQRIIRNKEKLSDRSVEIAIEPNMQQVKEIADELTEVIKKKNLLYLVASQLGYKCRILGINFNGDVKIFCNPMSCELKGLEMMKVQNASFPNKTYLLPRHTEIDVAYQTVEGKTERNKFTSPVAGVFENCIEMMDGILPCDFGLEIDDDFDELSEEDKNLVITQYLNNFTELKKILDKSIEEDDEARELKKGIEFWEKVQSGEVKLEMQDLDPNHKQVKLNRSQRRKLERESKKKSKFVAGKLLD